MLLLLALSFKAAIASCSPGGYSVHVDTLPASEQYQNAIKGYEYKDTIVGDFNGDGKQEMAWLESDPSNCQSTLSKKSCKGVLRFSDRKIPPLHIDYFPFGLHYNEGDLNGDGGDELGVLPGWFTSSCRDYYIYTLSNGSWIDAVDPIATTLATRAKGVKPIEKHPTKKGYAVIRYAGGDCCCQCDCNKEKVVKVR